MSTTLLITGSAVNADGAATPFTGTIVVTAAPAVVQSVVVVPPSAVPGVLRTITINAAGAVSYTCLVNGFVATATAQPNVFTFQA